MREVRMTKWLYSGDEAYLDFHTSYLGNYFHHLLQKNKDNWEALQSEENMTHTDTYNTNNLTGGAAINAYTEELA
jgi:hypothetical protein